MHKTHLSLYYLAGYLLFGGVGFLAAPQTMLRLFLSNGSYSDLMTRLVGLMLLVLGLVIVQIIRKQITQLYTTTLMVRALILITLVSLFFVYRDPFLLVLVAIVGLGFVLTSTAYLSDRRHA